MPRTLRDEIRQRRPFRSPEQETQLSLIRTAALLTDAFEQMLKPYGITSAQYNVLRILRGAHPHGLCRNEVRDRMLTRMPDMTRLLDRMEEAGLVSRARETEDRRMVRTHITDQGLELLHDLDEPVAQEHQRRFGHLTGAQLRQLTQLLGIVREATGTGES